MNTVITYGTYNVPSEEVSLSASYVVPSVLTAEQKAMFSSTGKMGESEKADFDKALTGLLNVPKPKK